MYFFWPVFLTPGRVVSYLINICCTAILWVQKMMPCLSLRGCSPQVQECCLFTDTSGHYVVFNLFLLNVLAVVSHKIF